MEEEWKVVPKFDLYEASSFGKIRNKKTKYELKQYVSNGYLLVTAYHEGKGKCLRVHRLVAMAFLLNPLNKPEVNHKDGNKKNNRVENLEWATKSENMKEYSRICGLPRVNGRIKNQCLKFENETEIKYFDSYQRACDHFERCLGTIWGATVNCEEKNNKWRGWTITRISDDEFNQVQTE